MNEGGENLSHSSDMVLTDHDQFSSEDQNMEVEGAPSVDEEERPNFAPARDIVGASRSAYY